MAQNRPVASAPRAACDRRGNWLDLNKTMTQDDDKFWRATPELPSEAPEWVNRDYSEDEPPKSRRWMIWVTLLASAGLAFSGMWDSLSPLFK